MDSEALERLHALAREWGGSLERIDLDDPLWDHVSQAPFSTRLGIDHNLKVVYFADDFVIGELIHEMGHVFASLHSPDFSEEYDFFGWEFAVAAQVGLAEEWIASAHNYSVGGTQYIEFGDMTYEEQSDLLEERYQHAQQLRLIRDGKPVSIRAPV